MDKILCSLFKIEKNTILPNFGRVQKIHVDVIGKNGCTLTGEAKGLELIDAPIVIPILKNGKDVAPPINKHEYRLIVQPDDEIFTVTYSTIFSEIKDVIHNDPATIVLWQDGSKTVVKRQEGDTYDPEKGLAMCIVKKICGNKGNYNNEIKKWLPAKQRKGRVKKCESSRKKTRQ